MHQYLSLDNLKYSEVLQYFLHHAFLRKLNENFISSKLDAPVDKIIGFFVFATFLSKGKLVISADAILKSGTIGLSSSTISLSNGVLKKSIFFLSQYFFNSLKSFILNLSYFLKVHIDL